MYNHIHIEKFIKKVNKEANEAAQAVFDKHLPELERMIKAQMNKGDKLFSGMGMCTFRSEKGEKLQEVLTGTQYGDVIEANFNLGNLEKD
jgi:hypothetical protein